MDYWTSFFKKRADEDISMYDSFEITKNSKLKYIYIKIKDGKLTCSKQPIHPNWNNRRDIIDYFTSKIDLKDMPDCEIPVNYDDDYGWQDKNVHFTFTKPESKKGILFPTWEFKNWETVKKNFTDNYIPWTQREKGPYFIGNDSTREYSDIRRIVKNLYPENVKLLEKNDTREPPTNLMKYKLAFNLPGSKPWSIRSALIDLSGCSRVEVNHYYSDWGEGRWYQFFEDNDKIDGVNIDSTYIKKFPKEKIPVLKDAIDDEIDKAIKRHAKAKANRDRMMELTTDHIVNYLEYIFREIAKRQNDR